MSTILSDQPLFWQKVKGSTSITRSSTSLLASTSTIQWICSRKDFLLSQLVFVSTSQWTTSLPPSLVSLSLNHNFNCPVNLLPPSLTSISFERRPLFQSTRGLPPLYSHPPLVRSCFQPSPSPSPTLSFALKVRISLQSPHSPLPHLPHSPHPSHRTWSWLKMFY